MSRWQSKVLSTPNTFDPLLPAATPNTNTDHKVYNLDFKKDIIYSNSNQNKRICSQVPPTLTHQSMIESNQLFFSTFYKSYESLKDFKRRRLGVEPRAYYR